MSRRNSCIVSQLPLRLFVGAYLLGIPAALADDAAGGCVQNRALDTSHYVDALKGDARNLGEAIFQQVPSDLTVAPESAAYLVQSDTAKRALPMEGAPTIGGMHSGERLVASCRVKGPTGDWWLVEKSDTGSLLYVAESKAQKLGAGGGAEIKAEPRTKDPNSKY
jgi:hypothetical protein